MRITPSRVDPWRKPPLHLLRAAKSADVPFLVLLVIAPIRWAFPSRFLPRSGSDPKFRVTGNVLCNILYVDSDHGDVVAQVFAFAPG